MKAGIRRALIAGLLLICGAAPVSAEAGVLVPVGQTVGLELETAGVYVLKFEGNDTPAQNGGLRAGDRITAVNGRPVHHAEELRSAAAASGGERLILEVERGGKPMSFTVWPQAAEGGWRLGVYLQDRISGLGTVTFYDPETGLFGALGHGVNEAGSGRPMVIRGGSALDADITSVRRGAPGVPGCLQGCAGGGGLLGTVEENTARGIFGHAADGSWAGAAVPVADGREITVGPAEIWSNVEGGRIDRYSVVIEELSFDAENGRNMKLRVTDPRLLERTGGIVQGMSGSPILQNGRLAGAVTHVLIQDPCRGYGIFIGQMLAGHCAQTDRQAA